jgi:hypothetical protein
MDIRERVEELQRRIARRDVVETAAASLVVATFALHAWFAPGALGRAGAIVVVDSAVAIAVRLHRARGRTAPDLPLREYCVAERARIDRQIRLLRGVLWWYVGPITAGGMLFLAGLPAPLAGKIVLSVGMATFGAFVWWLNQRAVRRELLPLRDRLARAAGESA